MSGFDSKKAQLPSTELGDERCIQIGYTWHGDIFIDAWKGQLDLDPERNDGASTHFSLSHSMDLMLLASCAGYLRRLGTSEQEVQETIREAGREIIQDDLGDLRLHSTGSERMAMLVGSGKPAKRYDQLDGALSCLVPPMPAQPGVLYKVGGTGIYTRHNPDGEDRLVYVSHLPVPEEETTRMGEYADFCSADIPVIAELICVRALGEYRKDLRKFIGTQCLGETDDLD